MLSSRQEDLQDLLASKQRKLDRQEAENESLLQQMEAYSQQAKASNLKLAGSEKVGKKKLLLVF